MSVSAFDHPLLSGLLGDDEIAPFFSAEAEIVEMIRFERDLAAAEGAEGVIPQASADYIIEQLDTFELNVEATRTATARDGTTGVEFVRQLREWLGPPYDQHVHFGSTSQDLVDTALVVRLRSVLVIDRQFGTQKLVARTRMQDAVPITVSAKLATWQGPLQRDLTRLEELLPRLMVLQFGGAAGTLDKLGDKARAVSNRLASVLGLGAPSQSWHTQRDNIVELAGWLSLVSGSLGKIGADIGLMGQNRVGDAPQAEPDRRRGAGRPGALQRDAGERHA